MRKEIHILHVVTGCVLPGEFKSQPTRQHVRHHGATRAEARQGARSRGARLCSAVHVGKSRSGDLTLPEDCRTLGDRQIEVRVFYGEPCPGQRVPDHGHARGTTDQEITIDLQAGELGARRVDDSARNIYRLSHQVRGSRFELLSGHFDAFLFVLVAQEQIGRRSHGEHLLGILDGNAQLGHEVIVHGGIVIVLEARLRDKTLQEDIF